jgi:hypothetical protein
MIAGKIALPAGIDPENCRVALQLLAPPTRVVGGRHRPRRNFAEQVYAALTVSPLGADVDAEGRFRIEGVREGNYRLMAQLSGKDTTRRRLVFVAVIERGYPAVVESSKLTVPFMKSGESDKPHDLGTLKFDFLPESG